jgi:hypothetical protein
VWDFMNVKRSSPCQLVAEWLYILRAEMFRARLTDDDNSRIRTWCTKAILRINPGYSTRQTSRLKCTSQPRLLSPFASPITCYLIIALMNLLSPRLTTLLISLCVVVIAIFFSLSKIESIATASRSLVQRLYSQLSPSHRTSNMTSSQRTPVYFLSHGGVRSPLSFTKTEL